MIRIEKCSITELETEAIVNAANEHLLAGAGVCGAIFAAAGHKELQEACNKIGHCNTGDAVITPGFYSRAKYIIHAVGPVWRGGTQGEPELLMGAYTNSLKRAMEAGCHSIGFPLISAGIYGYPVKPAWERAIKACAAFLSENPKWDMDIVFAVLSNDIYEIGKDQLVKRAPHWKVAEKSDWELFKMPEQRELFTLKRSFTPAQMNYLRRGNIPQDMEDRWFSYMEGNTLYIFRSWSGICIYIVTFFEDGNHTVIVNRDPEQQFCKNLKEDIVTLNCLLDQWTWTQSYYH